MYNDGASEVPLYLVPNREGTGKRLVRRPHPPPTTAPLPDDFDAITVTRDSTTVYDDVANSALGIDYDAITVAPAYEHSIPLRPTAPMSPSRNPMSPPRQRRGISPPRSVAGPDARSPHHPGDGHMYGKGLSAGKARSVAGDRSARRSIGSGNPPASTPLLPPFPIGKGPAMGRNDLIEKKVLEDGPERTISFWREDVAINSSEAGNGDGDDRSYADSHAGRRRVSTESRRRVESLAHVAGSVKGKGHRSKESADLTEAKLGVRRSEHMTALARMREETRDREVKEEALKKGITIVEWAILIDKLQSL
ncbi:hypothetical protein B0F90DRAFT_1666797 [Multifurca ochricompacta]|uniref:Uncharacterized protein n=1 Tax=Multifurca ochricompacta TaxID=376703 RepID=A0AAD4M731_9AGAM|nr:hypothetical protein B0F90DRAFT_1666797 [Multifurca ochricompacta]